MLASTSDPGFGAKLRSGCKDSAADISIAEPDGELKFHRVANKLLADPALIVVNRPGLGAFKLYGLEREGFVSAI